MKRPMLYILLFFIIGIICGQYANIALLAFISILLAGALAVAYKHFRFMFLLPVAIIGFMLYCANATTPNAVVDSFVDTDESIRVSGIVSSIIDKPQNNYGQSCFVFDGKVFDCNGNNIEADIRLRVYYKGEVSVGDNLVINGTLVKPYQMVSPSDFVYGKYLLAKGQRYIFYAKQAYFYGNNKSLNTMLDLLRDKMCGNFYKIMSQDEASVMCTMILGDKGGLDDEISELYRKTGIYHVLAISGLHITLLGAIIARLLGFLGKRRAYVVTMAVLLLYCIMTGCSATIVRAVIMFYTMAIGSFIYREYDVVSATAFAALLLLGYNPYYLYDVGFELSFAVVFALGAFLDISAKYDIQRFDALCVAVVADLASKPILMFYFYNINIWSLFANLILAPVMSFTVAAGFLCAVLGLVNLSIARLVAIPIAYILKAIVGWCNVVISLPFSYIITGKPNMYALLVYAILLFVGYWLIMCGRFKAMFTTIAVAFTILVVTTPAFLYETKIINNKKVTFLSDDCTVIEDDGNCYVVLSGKDDSLADYLMYSGIDKVNGVLATSAYAQAVDSEEFITPNKGDSIKINTYSKIECVYEDRNYMVVRYVSGDKAVLLSGKTDDKTKKLLCNGSYDIKADVLQLNSINENFVSSVSPEYIITTENMEDTGVVTVKLADKITVSNYLED